MVYEDKKVQPIRWDVAFSRYLNATFIILCFNVLKENRIHRVLATLSAMPMRTQHTLCKDFALLLECRTTYYAHNSDNDICED